MQACACVKAQEGKVSDTFYKRLILEGIFWGLDGYNYGNRHSHEAILASIVVSADQERIIDAAIAGLKAPFGAMLHARHGEGLTHAKIASRFSVSDSCSLTRIDKAHRQLKLPLRQVRDDFYKQINAFWKRTREGNERWRLYYQRKNELEEAMWRTLHEEFPDLVE